MHLRRCREATSLSVGRECEQHGRARRVVTIGPLGGRRQRHRRLRHEPIGRVTIITREPEAQSGAPALVVGITGRLREKRGSQAAGRQKRG